MVLGFLPSVGAGLGLGKLFGLDKGFSGNQGSQAVPFSQRWGNFAEGLGGGDVGGGEGRRSKQAFEQFGRYRGFLQRDFNNLRSQRERNPFLVSAQKSALALPGLVQGELSQLRSDQSAALGKLESGLMSSALASSTPGAVAAAQAARDSAGGRGGLGFGGGAGAYAALGATQGATAGGAAIAQALSGAAQARLGAAERAAGLGIQGALGSTSALTGFASRLHGQEVGAQSSLMQALAGLAGQGMGISFRQRNSGQEAQNFAAFGQGLGGIGSFLGAMRSM